MTGTFKVVVSLTAIYSLRLGSLGRAIALASALESVWASGLAISEFYVKVFYVIGKALTGKLSCPVTGFVSTYISFFVYVSFS